MLTSTKRAPIGIVWWMPRGNGRPVADLIDDLLAAQKLLAGEMRWGPGTRNDRMLFAVPVLVEGQTAEVELVAIANTSSSELDFTIVLNALGTCIWRVDYEPPHKMHLNPIEIGNPLSGKCIYGPHYHAWADNRHKTTRNTLPELDFARELLAHRNWDSTFRWFLGETKIDQPSTSDVPEYPKRTKLL